MRHVGIAAIDAARHDHAQRRLVAQHRAHLHRRGVRAQQAAVGEVERVVHRPRRMVRGDVERLEVVPVVLDFGTVLDREAGVAEQRLDAPARAGHRVQAAGLLAAARQRHVDAARGQLALELGALEFGRRASSTAPISSRTALMRAPAAWRSSGASAPSDFSCAVIAPFLPNSSTLSASSSARLAHGRHPRPGRRRPGRRGWGRGRVAHRALCPSRLAATEKAGPLARPGLVDFQNAKWGRYPFRAEMGSVPISAHLRLTRPRGSAFLACSTMAPNASMSCTARSASILRSISRPAAFRPAIRRL